MPPAAAPAVVPGRSTHGCLGIEQDGDSEVVVRALGILRDPRRHVGSLPAPLERSRLRDRHIHVANATNAPSLHRVGARPHRNHARKGRCPLLGRTKGEHARFAFARKASSARARSSVTPLHCALFSRGTNVAKRRAGEGRHNNTQLAPQSQAKKEILDEWLCRESQVPACLTGRSLARRVRARAGHDRYWRRPHRYVRRASPDLGNKTVQREPQ
jgi:hypothetical protein